MSTTVHDIVDAYRADVANAKRLDAFGERDALWILCGTVFERALALFGEERSEYLTSAFADLGPRVGPGIATSGSFTESDIGHVLDTIVEEAEVAGAFALAMVLLDLGRALVPVGAVRLQGRLATRQARVHRHLGELAAAEEIYDFVERSGSEHGDVELVCRGQLGKAIVARKRGNYPRARQYFQLVLENAAADAALTSLRAQAHQGMMIIAGEAKDYNAALAHGWTAYDGLEASPLDQAALLGNLSQLCILTGQYRAALNGFLSALAGPVLGITRLAAIGGAAVAAAHLGDRSVVTRLAGEAMGLIDDRNNQYEVADLERSFAEAFYRLGDDGQGDTWRQRSIDRATTCGFFEILFAAEGLGPGRMKAPEHGAEVSADAQQLASHLAQQDSGNLLLTAFRSDPPTRH